MSAQPQTLELKERTIVRMTLGKFFALMIAVVSATLAGSSAVISSVHEVRDGMNRHTQQIADLSLKLDSLSAGIAELQHSRAAEVEASRARGEEWTAWRWRITTDVVNLGAKTETKVLTQQ